MMILLDCVGIEMAAESVFVLIERTVLGDQRDSLLVLKTCSVLQSELDCIL